LASVELVQNALTTSARILKATLRNIPSEIDRYSQTLLPLIKEEGHDALFKMTHELKMTYNLILVITKSLSDLSDLMYQEFSEALDQGVANQASKPTSAAAYARVPDTHPSDSSKEETNLPPLSH